MGKRYYCNYCDKTMAATPAIVKTHNKGLVHQKLVLEHYQKFKDPETILEEESKKKPCSRYFQGDCLFGGICRFSHYSRQQIDGLREIVATKARLEMELSQPSFVELYQKLQDQKSQMQPENDTTVLCDKNGMTHILPWSYNPIFDNYKDNLPLSLRRFKTEDFEDASISTWG